MARARAKDAGVAVEVPVAPAAPPPSDPRALLAAAAAKATTAPTVEQKEDRVEWSLNEATRETFVRFVEAHLIEGLGKQAKDEAGTAVKGFAFDLFVETLWKTGAVPANPVFRTRDDRGRVDCSANFQVRATFSPNRHVPKPDKREHGKTPRGYLYDFLTSTGDGLSGHEAERLLDAELSFDPQIEIRNLTELTIGREREGKFVEATPAQKAAANKILNVILSAGVNGQATVPAFTDEDRAVLLEMSDAVRVTDPNGFLNRVRGYCSTRAQLRHVLTIIPPTLALAQVKFAENTPVGETSERKIAAAMRVLGLKNR